MTRAHSHRAPRLLKTLTAIVAISLLAAACGEDPAADDDGTPTSHPPGGATESPDTSAGVSTDNPLEGTTFTSTSLTGHDLVAGTAVRLSFDGQLGVSAGCNSMGGGYSLDGDRLVIDGPMWTTEMACDPPLMDQDTWLASWISDGLTWVLAGDVLTLTGGDVVMELAAESAEPGTVEGSWELDTILSGETASSVPADVETPTLEFTGLQVSAFTGCNRGAAPVEIAEDTITFGPLRLTRMACPEPAMQLEATVAATLEGTVPFTVTADRLTMGDERSGLVWRRTS